MAEVIEFHGVKIVGLPKGAGYGVVSAADGSLELSIHCPCKLTLTQTERPDGETAVGLGETGKRRRSVVSHTPGEAAADAADAAPAAPRRRTRCRTTGVEDPQEDTLAADVVADLNKEIDGASKLAAAEAAADEEEWRWRAVPGAPSLPRWGHSVTRVGDGQLFILGGENADECFNSGHIYQHTEGSWSFDPIPARQVRCLIALDSTHSLTFGRWSTFAVSLLTVGIVRRVLSATARGTLSRASAPRTAWTTPTQRIRTVLQSRRRGPQSCCSSAARL